jgi:hypothetical protein
MKITRHQLNELLRLITKSVLKEYSSLSTSSSNSNSGGNSSSNSTGSGTADDGVKPQDAQTAVEKAKQERDAKKSQIDKIRTADMDLKGVKTQQDYFTQQAKKNKDDIIAKQKEIQRLKGGPTPTVPAGGTVAENIRKMRA